MAVPHFVRDYGTLSAALGPAKRWPAGFYFKGQEKTMGARLFDIMPAAKQHSTASSHQGERRKDTKAARSSELRASDECLKLDDRRLPRASKPVGQHPCPTPANDATVADVIAWIRGSSSVASKVSPRLLWITGSENDEMALFPKLLRACQTDNLVAAYCQVDYKDSGIIPENLIPTLVYQLAHCDPVLKQLINQAIEKNQSVRDPRILLEKLLLRPLAQVLPAQKAILIDISGRRGDQKVDIHCPCGRRRGAPCYDSILSLLYDASQDPRMAFRVVLVGTPAFVGPWPWLTSTEAHKFIRHISLLDPRNASNAAYNEESRIFPPVLRSLTTEIRRLGKLADRSASPEQLEKDRIGVLRWLVGFQSCEYAKSLSLFLDPTHDSNSTPENRFSSFIVSESRPTSTYDDVFAAPSASIKGKVIDMVARVDRLHSSLKAAIAAAKEDPASLRGSLVREALYVAILSHQSQDRDPLAGSLLGKFLWGLTVLLKVNRRVSYPAAQFFLEQRREFPFGKLDEMVDGLQGLLHVPPKHGNDANMRYFYFQNQSLMEDFLVKKNRCTSRFFYAPGKQQVYRDLALCYMRTFMAMREVANKDEREYAFGLSLADASLPGMSLEYLIASSDDVESPVHPPLLQELMQFDVKAWLAYTHRHFEGKRRFELETLFKWVHVRCRPKFPHGLTAFLCNGLCRHWRGPIGDYLQKHDREFKHELHKNHASGKMVKQKKMEFWSENSAREVGQPLPNQGRPGRGSPG
ncbi:hypothetical protein BKA70DRAFT_781370 [Coprinopsis sp. MPI-PUGE-AT-0042]|nr:hypothetical protein BKA70DRAFT_781370 [Coprinopsis sp. MPI-PUGE-AT-0042]